MGVAPRGVALTRCTLLGGDAVEADLEHGALPDGDLSDGDLPEEDLEGDAWAGVLAAEAF